MVLMCVLDGAVVLHAGCSANTLLIIHQRSTAAACQPERLILKPNSSCQNRADYDTSRAEATANENATASTCMRS
jgi:hypothetical protein